MVEQKRYLWVPLLLAALAYLASFVLDDDLVAFLTEEDHLYEVVGATALFLTGVFFLVAYFRSHHLPKLVRLSFIVLTLLFFFGAGEEVSWGQRIFGFEVDGQGVNLQAETNFHNLTIFDIRTADIAMRDMFNAFWFGFTFAVPLAAAYSSRVSQWARRVIVIVPWSFGVLFLLNYGFSKIAKLLVRLDVDVAYTDQAVTEIRETNFSIFFAFLAFYVAFFMLRKQATTQPEEKAI